MVEKAAVGILLVMLALVGAVIVVGVASFLWKLFKTLLIFISLCIFCVYRVGS